jgi:uncharacterized RDD family membrane protein YckC
MITVLKNNVPWGPFTRAQIQEGIARGDFNLRYLAHSPGLKEWLPLGEVLDHFDRGQSPAASPNLPPIPREGALPPVPAHALKIESRPPAPPPIPARIPSPAPVAPPIPPQPAKKAVPPAVPNPALASFQTAPFFARAIAFGIDCLVLFVPFLILFGLGALTIQIGGMVEHNDPETMKQEWILFGEHLRQVLILVALGGGWLYTAFLESSAWQATVGKQWVGLKVIDVRGEKISVFRATGRHAAKCLSAAICFLGFVMALFNREGRTLHDLLAGTRVVRKPRH